MRMLRKSCARRLDSNISWYFHGNALCAFIEHSQMEFDQVDNIRGDVNSFADGSDWANCGKTFNKMPIELSNVNERFVVINISKIIPVGIVFVAKHSTSY